MQEILKNQFVCLNCGYNMVGFHPENCPFCGAAKEQFISALECSERFTVQEFSVNDKVTRLNSVPDLGYEHAAYRIVTPGKTIWIDCPSSFNEELTYPPDIITFTHHHFLGACNLYRLKFDAKTWINKKDSDNNLSKHFIFDHTFQKDFNTNNVQSFHINGHTQGFTFYVFEDALFVCDYVFVRDGKVAKFNPYGPQDKTILGAKSLRAIIEEKQLNHVCGQNYVMAFDKWFDGFIQLVE